MLNKLNIKLEISPYQDYIYLRKLPFPKFLITTGFTNIHNAKINALSLRNDFADIIINDTSIDGKNKKDLFHELVQKYNLIPESCYVIGDNPDSEIAAGTSLNMITVQILRDGAKKGTNAKYYIKSFQELEKILI